MRKLVLIFWILGLANLPTRVAAMSNSQPKSDPNECGRRLFEAGTYPLGRTYTRRGFGAAVVTGVAGLALYGGDKYLKYRNRPVPFGFADMKDPVNDLFKRVARGDRIVSAQLGRGSDNKFVDGDKQNPELAAIHPEGIFAAPEGIVLEILHQLIALETQSDPKKYAASYLAYLIKDREIFGDFSIKPMLFNALAHREKRVLEEHDDTPFIRRVMQLVHLGARFCGKRVKEVQGSNGQPMGFAEVKKVFYLLLETYAFMRVKDRTDWETRYISELAAIVKESEKDFIPTAKTEGRLKTMMETIFTEGLTPIVELAFESRRPVYLIGLPEYDWLIKKILTEQFKDKVYIEKIFQASGY